jgi:hypothetical protein
LYGSIDETPLRNPNLGLPILKGKWKILVNLWPFGIFYCDFVYCMANWFIVWPFGNFEVMWYISPLFGTLYQDKSGNPGLLNFDFLLYRFQIHENSGESR